MEVVKEFLWHASGFCGEHWHPNVMNVSVMLGVVWCVAKVVRSAVRARFARFEGTN
jgi:hypothetical protein